LDQLLAHTLVPEPSVLRFTPNRNDEAVVFGGDIPDS